MDTAKRSNYLKLMGVDVFVPKHQPLVVSAIPEVNESVVEPDIQATEQPKTTVSTSSSGLTWLAQKEQAELLVVLPKTTGALAPEPRQLLVNMLQAIGVKAADCAYVSASTDTSLSDAGNAEPSYTEFKGVIVFGKPAGDHMVLQCGARRVPGESYFDIHGKPLVVTLHPDELLDTPELKRQAWTDLKQLSRLMQ